MKFLFTNKEIDLSLAKDFENIELKEFGENSLLINDSSAITETKNLISVTNGYLRDYSIDKLTLQKESAAQHVYDRWPVADNFTGSFSTVIFGKNTSEIVIATDLCNIYPLYYLFKENCFFISNSIILLGRYSNAEFDNTGIFQRAVGPNFFNTGSRTILKNCKRLLPGEWIKLNLESEIKEKRYDNSLYSNIRPLGIKKDHLQQYWNQYKKEVSLCTQDHCEVNIALSGGIDSRVALAAIPKNLKIKAHTFGKASNYESKIASRLAKIKGAFQKSYFDPDQYFPDKKTFRKYSIQTESIKLNSWLEILENVVPSIKTPILLGELCEGLPARNIKRFSSSNFRNKNFFKFYIKKEEFEFTASTKDNFELWKKIKTDQILSWHDDNWFKKLDLEQYKSTIISDTIKDLTEIFDRISSHNLPFAELYDELFSWFTFTRMELSRQVNICNEKFYAFSPGMSLQMLRMTSNIHPNDRLYYRFVNELFDKIPDLKQFNKVPTSQIPIIPQNSPNFLKVPIWGIRSKIDDFLVRRLMKSKDKNKRYRLLNSINWVQVYQQEDMLKNIEEYYSVNHLTQDYFETFYNLANKRKQLVSWPFANMDIISGATLNIEIDLIRNHSE
ncbi:hypothetical protein G3I01_00225 [Gramella sp. MT6]|uniref:hypothetical protein n=1 Tax=Gramella sp. MT6 TaxID=2705471 RepID=UPI001C5EBD25|nr:hypothetical protein [Gramella sp. MT6]QYA23997.1 hypothetical protein G3I01_00225 [Gramella sp. MT6]